MNYKDYDNKVKINDTSDEATSNRNTNNDNDGDDANADDGDVGADKSVITAVLMFGARCWALGSLFINLWKLLLLL